MNTSHSPRRPSGNADLRDFPHETAKGLNKIKGCPTYRGAPHWIGNIGWLSGLPSACRGARRSWQDFEPRPAFTRRAAATPRTGWPAWLLRWIGNPSRSQTLHGSSRKTRELLREKVPPHFGGSPWLVSEKYFLAFRLERSIISEQ